MLVYKMKEYKSLLCKRAIYVTRAFYRAIKCFIILSRVESTRYVYRVAIISTPSKAYLSFLPNTEKWT